MKPLKNVISAWTGLIASVWFATALPAQERFELVAPQLQAASQARLTDGELQVISGGGSVTSYRREPRYDSADGSWRAFYNRASNQIIRWPNSSRGRFQIGALRGSSVSYRESQMEIRPLPSSRQAVDRSSQRLVLPEPMPAGGSQSGEPWSGAGQEAALLEMRDWLGRGGNATAYQPTPLFAQLNAREVTDPAAQLLRLATGDRGQDPLLLSRDEQSGLRIAPIGSAQQADWWVAPAGRGFVRLETYSRGRVLAISTTRNRGILLEPLSQDARQLWRVRGGHHQSRYLLESAFHPSWCLTQTGTGVALQPIAFTPQQLWFPFVAPPPPTFEPFWKSVSREVHPNPQLPPAELQLINSHRNAAIVLLGDARTQAAQSYRIEAGGSVVVSLDRDAGATLVETVEIRSPSGVWDRQQLVTAIPPSAFYDVSVYEEHLQSIAIDRTGKSPNPIEDVNYVPKSLGWFPLPAGTKLPAQGSLDVYQQARQANNPGAVRRLDPKQFDEPEPALSPTEAVLQEFQTKPRRSF